MYFALLETQNYTTVEDFNVLTLYVGQLVLAGGDDMTLLSKRNHH